MATYNYEDYLKRAETRVHPICEDDEIVVTGVSGRFPNSSNFAEFSDNLYNKVDMVDDDERRWRHTNPEIPKRMGKIDRLEKFDSAFFGVHFRQAHSMDPQCRLLLEHAYESVLDAGINPKALRGTRTGVFIGACFAESEKTWFYEKVPAGGVGLTGCARAMLANRISYTMGLTGPSFLLDTACSSSMYAIDLAFNALRNGECDAALVGGVNLLLHPHVTLQFARLGVLSDDGYCRPFDENANGYTRSEAVCVIFLQRARDAKRVYGTLVYSKANCDGFKEEGITYPSGKIQRELLSEFYKEINIDPRTINYVEAHATGTVVGDPEECWAIDQVFCQGRDAPLPVGSIKSNIGHTESTSGCCSVAKAILAYHHDLIPPNINFTKVRPSIPALTEGHLKVITDPTPLEGPLIAINSFGFGGANAHALLRGNMKRKVNNGIPRDPLPRLVIWSGRTEEACNAVMDDVSKRPLDGEYVALLNNIQSDSIPANLFRAYGVYVNDNGKNALCVSREVQHHTGLKRPIVFVFSGMGSQWTGMGTSLMQVPIFRDAINECHAVLKSRGLDLIQIITSEDPTIYDNILHSFVGIAAIQIGLTDILKELKLVPDYIIGHSVGELGCAYADGCFTRKEMILSAYSRGMASLETKVVFGAMAAIGLGYKKIRTILPPGVEVACHNGPDSCTISGPAENVSKFVKELKGKGVFAKEVPTSNIAYHSKYISEMGPKLLARLQEVIKDPKKRSEKWLSSSVPKSKWDKPESQYCSAEYQTNNLLSPVLFEETAALLPENALTIEIAPHGLLQAILKKSMTSAIHINLTQRGNKDNVNVLFTGLGKIYMNGVDIPIEKMYPPVQYPVSAGTPFISPLIKWDHSEDWFLAKFDTMKDGRSGERICKIALTDHDYEYVTGHVIDGRVLFPATGYLYLVWETLGMMRGTFYVDLELEFQDVQFLRATAMQKDTEVTFIVMVHRGTGRFEITEGDSPVVTGYVKVLENSKFVEFPDPPEPPLSCTLFDNRDFYKELRLRGYHYDGEFKSVVQARSDGLGGKIKWNLNFASFMDCMLQLLIIAKDTRDLIIPTGIDRIVINPMYHFNMAKSLGDAENTVFDVKVCNTLKLIRAGGIEIQGLRASAVGRRKPPGIPVLESYEFISHLPSSKLSVEDASRVLVQLGFENAHALKIKTVEIDDDHREPIIQLFHDALGDLPLVASEAMYLSKTEIDLPGVHVEDGKLSSLTNCTFIIASKWTNNLKFVETAISCLKEKAYLISREPLSTNFSDLTVPPSCKLVCAIPTDDELLVMFQYEKRKIFGVPTVVKVSSQDTEYTWIEEIKTAASSGPVTLVAEQETYSGILGLVNCLRREPIGHMVTCVFVADPKAPAFDSEHPLYKAQLRLGLAINVYINGKWGSYRHLKLEPHTELKRETNQCFVNALTRGDLTSLKWLQINPYIDGIERMPVRVVYSALNFRDVMLASGKLTDNYLNKSRNLDDCSLGLEFSGVTSDGRRVMGMLASGSLATHVQADPPLTWEIPAHWSLEEAATVPVVYCTVYYSLFCSANIKKGKKILIHSGTGGVGLAAIRVSLAYGLEVFTTVSTQEKREYLLKTFPQLTPSHIGYSRDTSFYEMIMFETNAAGVDYVLNSLAEENLKVSIKCLGKEGKFLEIGKFDMANDNKIGLAHFLNEISFHAILLDNLFGAGEERKKFIHELLYRDICNGIVVPLKTTIFPANEVEQAFRYLASGKHIGKVLLKIRDREFEKESLPINYQPRVYFDPKLSYIVPGGLGGFGLELADWMIIRGCRKLVLSSSRGISKPYQSYRIGLWRSYGTQILISTADITTPGGCLELIQESNKLGPVGGIFNLAVRLRDAIFENQNPQMFAESVGVKATATKYLDEISRRLCPQLQHFVVFSSVSCGRGNGGQTNYGMANSVMERIIEARHSKGLPGTAIQWGAVGEVGLVADMHENSKIDMEIGGTLQQRISSCLQELDVLLTSNKPIVSCMVVAEKKLRGSGKGSVLEAVMNIMSIRDIKSVSFDTKLSELGMDSLMAVEIKQTLEREFEICLTPLDVRTLTFSKLQTLADAKNTDSEACKLKYAKDDTPQGMGMLMRNFGDETHCEQTLLRVQSQNNTDNGLSGLVLIPGIEGVAGDIYRVVANGFNLPTFILQLTKTGHLTTTREIAEAVFEEISQNVFKNTDFYYLVGYSFGSLVTLELARMFEERGLKGHVVLIDGSPAFLKKLSSDQVSLVTEKDDKDKQLHDTLMMAALRVIFPGEELEFWNTIESVGSDWNTRIEKLIEVGINHNIYSADYTRNMMNALFNRTKMASENNLEEHFQIESDITIIRPTEVSVMEIDEDYGLSAYTKGHVNLKFVEGNHVTMLENSKLIQIINEVDPFLKSERTFVSYMHG